MQFHSVYRIYLDNCLAVGDATTPIPNCSLELLGLELRFFGATITDELDVNVSHVIVNARLVHFIFRIIHYIIDFIKKNKNKNYITMWNIEKWHNLERKCNKYNL